MELKLNAVRGAAWLPACLSAASGAGCAALAVGSLACLVVAGVHYAVSSGLHTPAEIEGTRIVIGYSLGLSVLMGATSVAGSALDSPRLRAPALATGAAACAAIVGACEASSCFGATDCAFGLDFLHGVNVGLGAACALAACIGAALWAVSARDARLGAPAEGAIEGQGATADESTADTDFAGAASDPTADEPAADVLEPPADAPCEDEPDDDAPGAAQDAAHLEAGAEGEESLPSERPLPADPEGGEGL